MDNRKVSPAQSKLMQTDECLLLRDDNHGPLHSEIISYLEIEEFGYGLGRTCKLFQHPLLQTRLAHFTVVDPSEIEVRKMLEGVSLDELQKRLSQKIGRVICRKGEECERIFNNYTLLQLAYAVGDAEMCELYKSFFERAYGCEAGIDRMQKQLDEKFSENAESKKENEEYKKHLIELLNPVIQAIDNEQIGNNYVSYNDGFRHILSSHTLEAIRTFKEEFKKMQAEVVDKGINFVETLQIVVEACAAAERQHYDTRKCILFDDGILSCVLNYAPENDIQRFNQGLINLYVEGHRQNFKRQSLTDEGHKFSDLLHKESPDFVDLTSSVDIIRWLSGGRGPIFGLLLPMIQKLCQEKTSSLQKLCGYPREQQQFGR